MRMAEKISFLTRSLLLLIALLSWNHMAAAQQPQEKRVALVVGDGAYAKSPLATAANDAGLIAQTLQAAGFDVIGARDLDADSLRKSFHDFMQKAQADPANTVAVVYLAGYGVQLSGENYFIAVDSNVNSATDIPIEGLRISDYTRQLASVPLKASVFVLDAARQQPFIDGGPQPLAGGLALVEASPNMLIAFNAAPGTVAPTETGSYGLYAQSLAEMIRTGGLTLPDVFDRVRLRVSENSKGAQVPWDDQKITAQFSFFDRAPDAPKEVGAGQVAAIRDKPMRDLSVTDAYAAALERDTMQGYQDFLAAYPTDPMSKRVRAILAARREAITWRRTYLADTPQAYWSYLRRYPDGPHAWDARRRLETLNALLEPPPSFAMIDYDVPPPPPDEVVYVDRPVVYFGDPDFGFAPPPPPPVYFLPPPPPDFVVLAPPFAAVGLFVLPQPLFVPVPEYCRPPVYVAPPPNNIIFNNIHNTTVINNVINVPPPQVAANNPAAAAAAAASAQPVGATTPVPNIVRTQALSIQKNPTKELSPSQRAFVSDPKAKAGNMAVTPAKLTSPTTSSPTIQPDHALKTGKELPRTDTVNPTLIAPNAKGVNNNAKVTSPTETTNPNAKGGNPNTKLTSPTEAAKPNAGLPNTSLKEEAAKPHANVKEDKSAPATTTNPATPGKPTATQTPLSAPEHEKRMSTAPTTQTPARPELKPESRLAKPEVKPEAKPARPTPAPAPKPEAKRVAPPPPPPKPAPAPKPPAIAARPPPAPHPPPAPRPPPPPKPAAVAKKCPPNAKKC
jgi:uncharacterized caspase-like protein